ncbi:MAG: peptidyl-prolyl cis-trans isomerase [Nitrospirae bacterium]|nr:peptidyl-prolyl cis-trans isomerase [Nitrospirota bacterium]
MKYEKNKAFFTQPETSSVIDVAIKLDPSDRAPETRAEDVLKKIRENGNDPQKLVQDGTFVVREYELKKDSDKEKELFEASRKLNPGEVSDLIKTVDSFHIIKLVEYNPEKVHTLDEVKDIIEKKLRTDIQNQMTKEWTEGLRKNAKIEILVHEAQ